MELVANFTLNNETLDAQFDISEIKNFDALFEINATPDKVSQLENDLNFQTGDEVQETVNTAIETVNERIDEKVENLTDQLGEMVQTVVGSELIGVDRIGQTVTITAKTFIFEQGIASDKWTINHNLNKYPSITTVDSTGRIFKSQIEYSNLNTCTVYINGSTTGKAYLN